MAKESERGTESERRKRKNKGMGPTNEGSGH